MSHEKKTIAELDGRNRPPGGLAPAAMQSAAVRFGGTSLQVPISDAGARMLFLCLIAVEAGLAGIHLVVQLTDEVVRWGPIKPLFDLDAERSVPTWFSTIQLFIMGAVLLLVAANNRRPQQLPNWLLLVGAAGFILLSADEAAMFHERITESVTRLGQDWFQFPGGYGDWIVPYLILCVTTLLVLARPLAKVVRVYPAEASIAIAGAVLIVLGAVGLEITSYVLRDNGGAWYEVEVAVEEFMEMAGASVILYAALLLAIRVTSES